MIKCKYFRKDIEYDERGFSKLVYTPMSQFNKWNQADVESIISIDTCANQDGEIETIVVYYNAKESTE